MKKQIKSQKSNIKNNSSVIPTRSEERMEGSKSTESVEKDSSTSLGMTKKYIPADIEKKWQKIWEESGLYKFSQHPKNPQSPKYYTLVEWPYPSGDLHIGHWFSFATADVHARAHKMMGQNVFFTNGFDAFGLPAENAAIKRGIHPQDWTIKNMKTMRNQFNTMGSMIDWSHTTAACFPEYYKWNQWIFTSMFEKGLAYRGKMLTNWCPVDQTVLANENIENGKCWRCGSEVIQKEVEQWFIKLTAYADKLIWPNPTEEVRSKNQESSSLRQTQTKPDLVQTKTTSSLSKSEGRVEGPEAATVDWPVSVKVAQNQWIGKKEGVKIKHNVIGTDLEFESFSAYPAWSWADRFIVISPEHPIVNEILKQVQDEDTKVKIRSFVEKMSKETDLERQESKEKLGVFTGKYAKDPFGGPDMPIWLANFALLHFGTGIIRCSGHDERDIEFAKKYGIATGEAVAPRKNGKNATPHDGMGGILKDSGPFTGKDVWEVVPEVIDWIEKQGIGKRHVNYHIHDWSISRQRYWGTPVPFVYCKNCYKNMNKSEYQNPKFETNANNKNPNDQNQKRLRNLNLENSDIVSSFDIGDSNLVYGRDYIEINGEKYAMIPVPDDQLPVELPYNVDFTPKGEPPLASNKEWMQVTCPQCGGEATRDPETLDTFFDSSWYFFRYINPHYNEGPFPEKEAEKLLPVDIYFGGAEHTLGHTLYARFFTRFFKELGLIDFEEFAKRRVQHGVILGTDGNRMSKSKGNVVNPDDVVKEYGADAVRVYLCFMMPYDATAPWAPGGMWGTYRFLKRVWDLQFKVTHVIASGSQAISVKDKIAPSGADSSNDNLSKKDLYEMHTAIKKVREDAGSTKFNTGVSTLMKWINYLSAKNTISIEEYKTFLLLLAPFAPHITEELWQRLTIKDLRFKNQEGKDIHKSSIINHESSWSIHQQRWPDYEEKYLQEETVTIVVQVNGKVRDNIAVRAEVISDKQQVIDLAKKSEKVSKHLNGISAKQIVYVPGRIVNFVV